MSKEEDFGYYPRRPSDPSKASLEEKSEQDKQTWINKVNGLKLPDISEVMANAKGDAVQAAIINNAGSYAEGVRVIQGRINEELIPRQATPENDYELRLGDFRNMHNNRDKANAAVEVVKAILEATGFSKKVEQILKALEPKGQSK